VFLSAYFERLLPGIEADLRTILAPVETWPPLFFQMLHYHMGWVDEHGQPVETERGKRIRPMLALLVSEAVCGDPHPARPAAAAVELIHNFSLLHDDIQDRSPTRRGYPTVWVLWGDRQGINAGDALFALAHLAIPRLADPGADGTMLTQLLRILDETCLELTRGQHLDMLFEAQANVTVDDYLDMIAGKTSALIASAAHMGALAAGADGATQREYRAFGASLGMAFQVLDDVLDIWGDPVVTGKEPAIDIRERKKSLPVLFGLSQSGDLRRLYTSSEPFDEERVKLAISLLDKVSAREYAHRLAQDFSKKTVEHLEAANPQGKAGQVLYELVDLLLHRDR
jgi:geranylgeranyl diphosphate synthase type I